MRTDARDECRTKLLNSVVQFLQRVANMDEHVTYFNFMLQFRCDAGREDFIEMR